MDIGKAPRGGSAEGLRGGAPRRSSAGALLMPANKECELCVDLRAARSFFKKTNQKTIPT